MRVAFIGAYGYGNLGDELCLIDAMAKFPHTQAFAFSVNGRWTQACVPALSGTFKTETELRMLKPEAIVYGGGGIGTPQVLNVFLPWMLDHQRAGVGCNVYNIGVAMATDADWLDDEKKQFFRELEIFSVRDYKSVEIASQWSIGRIPQVTNFPERALSPDFTLADQLLDKDTKYLGISIINMASMRNCLKKDTATVQALLARFPDHVIVPIISTIHVQEAGESDDIGFNNFAADFLKGRKVVGRELLDRQFWTENLSPRRLKGLIARLDTLISHRKHNCVHGIGAGVRTIGLHPIADDSLSRTFVALSQYLVPGSLPIGLNAA